MRVLNIISQYPGKTGSGTYLQALIREGKKSGNPQGLIAALPAGHEYNKPYMDAFYPVYFETEALPFPIIGMSDVMPYKSITYADLDETRLRIWMAAFKATILKAIEDFKPDVIIAHHLWILTSMVVALSGDIKTIGVCHGTDIRQLTSNPQFEDLVTKNMKGLDGVIALNTIQREEIWKHYEVPLQRIHVVGGGFNQDLFYPKKNKTTDTSIGLIYVGKLSYQKGVLSLMRIFKKIRDEYPVRLTIVGSGFGKEESHIKRLGQYKDISFVGEVSQKTLGNLYRASDIFVLPSFYEGLSLVTLEALASGLLAVVSEIPGLKNFLGQVINQSGVIEYIALPEMQYESLPKGKALQLFETDLELKLRKQMAHLSRYHCTNRVQDEIEKRSWTKIYRQMVDIINSVKKA